MDVTFQRYKATPLKHPPNNSAIDTMASSHNGKEVVRYIKVGLHTRLGLLF
jgi:hypothetical protein